MADLGSIKDDESKFDLICNWLETGHVPETENFSGAVTGGKEFKFMMLEEKRAYYKQGLVIEFIYQKHMAMLTKIWRKGEDFFHGYSDKEIDRLRAYYLYVKDIEEQGRTLKDIYEIPLNKAYVISTCENKLYYETLEKLVIENKIGVQILKRTVEIINTEENYTVETAYIKAKNEAEERRKLKKENKLEETELHRLKIRYNEIEKDWQFYVEKYQKLEDRYNDLKEENRDIRTKYNELEEKFNNLLKQSLNKTKLVNKNELKNIVLPKPDKIVETDKINNKEFVDTKT